MRSIQRFSHLMSSTVLVAQRTGMDGFGSPVFGPDVPYRAHIVGKQQVVRRLNGEGVSEEVVSSTTVYLATTAAMRPGSRVTLSTGDAGSTEADVRQPPLLASIRRFDQSGPHHTVLYLE